MSIEAADIRAIVSVHLGEADEAALAALEARLSHEPSLLAAFEGVRGLLGALAGEPLASPPPELTASVQRWARQGGALGVGEAGSRAIGAVRDFLAVLVRQSGAGMPAPGMRGGVTDQHLVFDSALGEVDLRIETATAAGGVDRRRLAGVLGLQVPARRGVAIIELTDGSMPRVVAELDEGGVFVAEIAPGRARVVFEVDGNSLSLPEIDVR